MNNQNKIYFSQLNDTFDLDKGISSFSNIESELDKNDIGMASEITAFKLNDIIEKYKLKDLSESSKIQLKHFVQYSLFNKFSKNVFEKHLYSFYIAKSKDPLASLIEIFYSNLASTKIIELSNIFTKYDFSKLIVSQFNSINNYIFYYDSNNEYYKTIDQTVLSKILNIISNFKLKNIDDIFEFLKAFCEEFKIINLTYDIRNVKDTKYIESDKYQDLNKVHYKEYEYTVPIENYVKTLHINDLLYPEEALLDKLFKKYSKFLEDKNNAQQFCSILKTVLYLSTYLTRNKSQLYPCKLMKNLTSVDTSWAVGTEMTFSPSFYGKSEAAKAFSSYYAFMEGKRNPYYELINNRTYNYMDEQALKMHKYFRDQDYTKYFYDLFYEKKLIGGKSIAELLISLESLIEVLEKPIVVDTLGFLAEIKGIVTSMFNTIAQILDLSISLALRQLFYIKFIPLGNGRYSVADIYNYLVFLKLVFEKVDDKLIIEKINREDFVNLAYQTLGIRRNDIEKIGYCAYDDKMNDASGLNLYQEELVQNEFSLPFTLNRNSKLFYTIIQYAIFKKCYQTGNNQFYFNFNFGSKSNITSLIGNLTKAEIFYCFKMFNIDPFKFNRLNLDDVTVFKKFNKELKDISGEYNLKDFSLYSDSLRLLEAIELSFDYDTFKNGNFNKYLNLCMKEYFEVIDENKKRIDKIVFSSNNISDIDDFVMRFLPSIIEIMKLIGMHDNTFKGIVKALDYICYFISDVLFRNIFMKIKLGLAEKIREFSDSIVAFIDDLGLDNKEYIFQIELGGSYFKKRIDSILDFIENLAINGSLVKDCFNDIDLRDGFGPYGENDQYGNRILDQLEINWWDDDSLLKKELFTKTEKSPYPIYNIFDKAKNNDRNSLIYLDGELYIGTPDGIKTKVVYKDDYISDTGSKFTVDAEHILKLHFFDDENNTNNISEFDKKNLYDKNKIENATDKSNSNLIHSNGTINIINNDKNKNISPKTEYETLIEIRDFISNIQNKKLINLINKRNQIEKEISFEINKKMPNNNIITILKKELVKLTEEIEYAKSKNDKYVSVPDASKISDPNINYGSDFIKEENEIIISKNYTGIDVALDKKNLLKEINDVVIANNLPLTNYEIIQLLN